MTEISARKEFGSFVMFYFISPKIWAWNTSRAWKIKKNVDRMFVILPFEKAFYAKFGYEVDFDIISCEKGQCRMTVRKPAPEDG